MNSSRSVRWKDSAPVSSKPKERLMGLPRMVGLGGLVSARPVQARVGSRVPIERMGLWIPKVGRTA
ncbi:hypothetical protein RND71_022530 [Anisodus tanguticus]|uniref:Uncharacterized protein n=1 Tax=Anisodus tanguticus TaxID=243964 RepID=A0AAE1VDU9_9SOLA|nr:hypothetical protein RND71_022530 [Anisodus tanguticus]